MKNIFLFFFTLIICVGCTSTRVKYIKLNDCGASASDTIIPELNIDNLPFKEAVDTIYELWLKQNGNKPIPKIVIINSEPEENVNLENIISEKEYDNSNCHITLVTKDLSVIRCIEEICKISGWSYKEIQGNIILLPPSLVITEPWEVKQYHLSPMQIDFLNITAKMNQEDLAKVLIKYGIKMPSDIGAKATWEPGTGYLTVFTLNSEHDKLKQLLEHIIP